MLNFPFVHMRNTVINITERKKLFWINSPFPNPLISSLIFYVSVKKLFSYKHLISFFISSCLLLLLRQVAVVKEVTEESDEAEGVGQHDDVHGVREVAVGKQVVAGVDGYYEKLELKGARDGWKDTRNDKGI